jgi:hypothetical protein
MDQDYPGSDMALHNCNDGYLGNNGVDLKPMSAEQCTAACATAANCSAYAFIASPSRGCPFQSWVLFKTGLPALAQPTTIGTVGIITGRVNGEQCWQPTSQLCCAVLCCIDSSGRQQLDTIGSASIITGCNSPCSVCIIQSIALQRLLCNSHARIAALVALWCFQQCFVGRIP